MYDILKNYMKELNRKFNYCDVRYETSSILEFSVNNNVTSIKRNGIISGGNIRIIHSGVPPSALSFTRIENVHEGLKRIQNNSYCKKNSEIKFADISMNTGIYNTKIKKSKSVCNLEDKINIFKGYSDLVRQKFSTITNVRFGYKEICTEKFFYNCEGIDITQELHDIAFFCEVTLKGNGFTIKRTFHDGSSNNYDIILNRGKDILDFCENVVNLTRLRKKETVGDINCNNIILDQDLSATLIHEIIGHFSEADNSVNFNDIERNTRIGHEALNISDIPLIGARGFSFFDDEGTRCEKQQIITNGRITGRLHDRKSAYKFKEVPKGNARSLDYTYTPICRMRHTLMDNGTSNIEDVICSIKNGIYILGSRGGNCGENFSLNGVYGRIIRNGKIEDVIDNIYVFGNVYEVLGGLNEICSDKKIINKYGGCGKFNQYPLAVSYSSPSLFFSSGLKLGVYKC